jgi:hypothetical protein
LVVAVLELQAVLEQTEMIQFLVQYRALEAVAVVGLFPQKEDQEAGVDHKEIAWELLAQPDKATLVAVD